jgi:hypothetical protein
MLVVGDIYPCDPGHTVTPNLMANSKKPEILSAYC